MVTHNPQIAAQADRVVRLAEGRIEEWAPRLGLILGAAAEASPRRRAAAEGHPMSLKVYINGKLFDKDDAKISVYDHGLLYGDGVFEGIRVYDGKVFRLERAHRPALRVGPAPSSSRSR